MYIGDNNLIWKINNFKMRKNQHDKIVWTGKRKKIQENISFNHGCKGSVKIKV